MVYLQVIKIISQLNIVTYDVLQKSISINLNSCSSGKKVDPFAEAKILATIPCR